MFKNKKVILGGTVVVALAIVMAGTFAWFTDSDEVVNKMKLANFNVKITEDWVEEDHQNLEPNAEVDKVVRVSNNGTADAVVRVSLEETLRLFEVVEKDVDVETPEEGDVSEDLPAQEVEEDELKIYWEADPITENDTDYEDYIAVPKYILPEGTKTENVADTEITYYTAITSLKNEDGTQCFVAVDEHDGLARYNPDTKAVEYAYYKYAKETAEDSEDYFKPEFNTKAWTLIGDYYYYNKIVKAGEVTEPLFSKVNVSVDLPNTYIGSIYHLTPKMEAVQAKAEAITGTWGLAETDFLATWDFGTSEEEVTELEEQV